MGRQSSVAPVAGLQPSVSAGFGLVTTELWITKNTEQTVTCAAGGKEAEEHLQSSGRKKERAA